MGSLTEDLRKPGDEFRETHISWVFLQHDKVYKVKRPVNLGFVDFSTLAQRRWACDQEISLNRRLAPNAYLGVIPITLATNGRHQIDGDGKIVDWAVCMRRLSDRQRVDLLLAEGALNNNDVDRIAETLATFHQRAQTNGEISQFGLPDQIIRNIRGNFGVQRPAVRAYLSPLECETLESKQVEFVQTHETLFLRRVREGFIRDGHGDLKSEHFYIEDQEVTVLDCVEFSTAFRCGDVIADLAYLSMELRASGHLALAERLLAQYALLSGDYQLFELVDFYEAYRASVRASVAAILAQDDDAPASVRNDAHKTALKFFQHLRAPARDSSVPTLFVVAGMIASGKSTLSRKLSSLIHAPVLSSDWTRKELAQVSPTTPLHDGAFSGHYGASQTNRVYATLMNRAKHILISGRSVVVDASFSTRELRTMVRQLATDTGSHFHLLECSATPKATRERLKIRSNEECVSDGRLEIYEQFVKNWEAIDELPSEQHTIFNTAQDSAAQAEVLSRLVPSPPA